MQKKKNNNSNYNSTKENQRTILNNLRMGKLSMNDTNPEAKSEKN